MEYSASLLQWYVNCETKVKQIICTVLLIDADSLLIKNKKEMASKPLESRGRVRSKQKTVLVGAN